MTSIPLTPNISRMTSAAPFWLSILLLPLVAISAANGGWTLLLVPLATWYLFSVLDVIVGHNKENADPNTPDDQLFWYRAITIIWAPLQVALIFGTMIYVFATGHLAAWEQWALFVGIGVISGAIGINYSHELMHQKPTLERWMADILLASVLYSHFRSEHLLVHHRYVATRKTLSLRVMAKAFGVISRVSCTNAIGPRSTRKRRCLPAKSCLGPTAAIHFGGTGPCKVVF